MPTLNSPATTFKAITPHDTNPIQNVANETIKTRWIVVAVSGLVACVGDDGQAVNVPAAAGVPMPVSTSIIKASGTTATGIVALW